MNARLSSRSCLAALIALLAVGVCVETSAQSVTTVPVGAVTLTFPASSSTACSLQLEDAPVYSGSLTGVTANTITVAGVSWTTNSYADPALPYAVRITSGGYAGTLFPITANASNQLSLQVDGLDLSTILAGSENFIILPIDTLGTLFGTSSVPFLTGASAASADVIYIWSGAAWSAYFHNGTSWRRGGVGGSQNNAIISPDAALFVLRRGTSDISLTITGQVRPQVARRFMKPNGLTFLANPFPVDMVLSSTNFNNSTAWQTGASAASADTVYVWTGTAWSGYFHNGTTWRRGGVGGSQDSAIIPAGSPFFVLRRSNPALKDSTVMHTAPYTL